MFSFCEGYVIEGHKDPHPKWVEEEDKAVPNLRLQPSLYRAHFLNTDHETFLGNMSSGPMLACVKRENDSYRVLVYTDTGIESVITPSWTVFKPWYNYLLCRPIAAVDVIRTVKPQADKFSMKGVKSDSIQQELLALYEPEYSSQQKIGLLYSRAEQTNEQEMLANLEEESSPAFREFLEFLGDRVALKGFTGYSGGLDTINNYSGTHSVYTKFQNSEMMFHVSTLLPHTPANPVQIERKKHIGNDRLIIVFKDGDEPYVPNTLKSKQTQVVIIVQKTSTPPSDGTATPPPQHKNKGKESEVTLDIRSDGSSSSTPKLSSGSPTYYKVAIASRIEIPQCEPWLPEVPIFEKGPEFREFLLKKVINAMLAMRHSVIFEKKTQREKALKFLHIVDKYSATERPNSTKGKIYLSADNIDK